jgi:hypothetical protein
MALSVYFEFGGLYDYNFSPQTQPQHLQRRQEALQQQIAREKFVSDCRALLNDVPGQ